MTTGEPTSVPSLASRSAFAITRFTLIFAILLTFDLALKSWAFKGYAPASDIHPNPPRLTLPSDGNLNLETATNIKPGEEKNLIPNVLSLRLLYNPGAVFGLGKGGRWIFVVATCIATIIIIVFFCKSRANQWVTHIALACVLAGALGNLYDRIVYAVVRDMLFLFPGVDLPFDLAWPNGQTAVYPWIFNPADVFLLVGIFFIFFRHLLFAEPTPSSTNKQPSQNPT